MTQAIAGEALEDAGLGPGELQAVGIANQRETVCVWDPESGEPLHRAIVWQDRRTASRCDQLRAAGLAALIRDRTGLVLDPYFSGTKIEWLLQNVDGLPERAQQGRAVFGTVDAWLHFKLTGESVTDPSNASRTMLFGDRTSASRCWRNGAERSSEHNHGFSSLKLWHRTTLTCLPPHSAPTRAI